MGKMVCQQVFRYKHLIFEEESFATAASLAIGSTAYSKCDELQTHSNTSHFDSMSSSFKKGKLLSVSSNACSIEKFKYLNKAYYVCFNKNL